MATEETDGGEFQEKAGLKRKLTGPPRLLLGKPRSPVRDEIKSDAHVFRKQQRHKFSEAVKDKAAVHQGNSELGCESLCVACPSPQSAFTVKEGAISLDLQEKSLEITLDLQERRVKRKHGKNRLKKSRAKAAFRRVFSPAFMCVLKRKKTVIKSEEFLEDKTVHRACLSLQDAPGDSNTTQEPSTILSVPFSMTKRCKKEALMQAGTGTIKRKFHVRIWNFFKRHSVKSERNLSQEEGCVRPCIDTFIEIERKPACCAPESSGTLAADEQLNRSSKIHEDNARITVETCPGKDADHREEGTEMMSTDVSAVPNTAFIHEKVEQVSYLKQDVCKHHQFPNIVGEEDTKVQITEILAPIGLLHSQVPLPSVHECSSDTEVTEMSSDIPVTRVIALIDTYKIVPIENEVKCKPVITIEDVHSSDEEKQEPIENNPPQCDRLSTVVSANGSCYPLKINSMANDTFQTLDQSEHKSLLSELALVQTALSLVHGAISWIRGSEAAYI
ncbi:hypothetical protein P4O66_001093 [Electrophorus voltai]|uniref:Uncharacterized protein n=1 Tax=Electrophorus voltai TaxID=2609070 RepID=A0AAD8Z9Z8_9TELE|nr:hypothetical protein P4O66_001093 [Electrophorus voltai]